MPAVKKVKKKQTTATKRAKTTKKKTAKKSRSSTGKKKDESPAESTVEPLSVLSFRELRQMLAGLRVRDTATPIDRAEFRDLALEFLGVLPAVYGEQLDRRDLWSRISSAVQTAFAKVVGGDYEFFIHAVLEHLCAEPAAVAHNEQLRAVLTRLQRWSEPQRQAWFAYLHAHLYSLIVLAQAARKKEN
ncbi:MAG TPA: hypothetical protein EYP04_05880 [Anaerolineae bacterium]|nr:hypothetical protein [Anaerolineae bacterium]